MTEKRFTVEIIENDVFIHQEGANHYLGHKDYVNADMVCNLLNDLNDENEQLKKENRKLKEDLEHCANQFTNDGKNVLLSLR